MKHVAKYSDLRLFKEIYNIINSNFYIFIKKKIDFNLKNTSSIFKINQEQKIKI